jgi:PAS domain S-box-containing protein
MRDQVRVVYQPVVHTEDHHIVAAEAFARWSHPQLGDISPEVFRPAAARLGLTGALTAQVLNTACAQLVDWKATGKLAVEALVAVNLSADDLVDPNLVGSVRHALERAGLDARYLAVEVGEIGLVRDPATALARLHELRRLGARIAIDGFGAGYSSLAYLKPPIEAVKIDRSLVLGLGRDAEATSLVRGILSLTRALGLTVVAEGIENDVQLEALRQLGCFQAQGGFFCGPVPPEEFPSTVRTAPGPSQSALLAGAGLDIDSTNGPQHLGQAVLDALPASVAVLAADGTIMATNLAWKRFSLEHGGNASSSGVGVNYLDVCRNARGEGAQEAASTARDLRAVLSGDRDIFRVEYDCSDDTEVRQFIMTATPVATGGGAVVVVHLDITARHLAEVALAESEERFRSIFDQAPLGILRLDAQGRIVDANRALCEIVGRPLGELEGSLRAELFDDAGAAPSPLPEDRVGPRADAPRSSQRRARRPDGTTRVVQVNDVVVHDKEGGSHTLVATVEDVTDSLRLADDLRRAQQMEALGQLAAGIAHEINTPTQFISDNLSFLSDIWGPVVKLLAASRSAVARLREGDAPGDVAAALEQGCAEVDLDFVEAEVPTALSQSKEGVERVATIVRAMKAFGRPDPSDPEPTDIDHLVANAITVARNELKYVAEVTAELGAHQTAMCFPGAISQVVLNLLVNAAYAVGESQDKTGGRGQISVKTWAQADRVGISVSDTGPGIPPHVLPRIFQPFFTTKPFGRGSGQGLAMAWATVVDRHAGQIDVATSEAGTTFTVTLPVEGRTGHGAARAPAALRAPQGRAPALLPGQSQDGG